MMTRHMITREMAMLLSAIVPLAVVAGPAATTAARSQTVEVRELPLSGAAYTVASEAYAAYDRRDFETAIEKAREAIRQRPDVARLKTLLVDALAASGRIDEAGRTAQAFIDSGEASPELRERLSVITATRAQREADARAEAAPKAELPPAADPAFTAATRAYDEQRRGDHGAALASAREAARLAPGNRDYGLLLVNTLLATGRRAEAEQEIGRVLTRFGPDADLLVQRGYLRFEAGRFTLAADDFSRALSSTGPAADRRALRLALADAAQAGGQHVRALDALAGFGPTAGVDHAVASRRGQVLLALGRREDALAAFTRAAATARTVPERDRAIAKQIGLLLDLGREPEARAVFASARAAEGLASLPPLDLAYLAVRLGDDATAHAAFGRARQTGDLEGLALVDAAYVSKRVFDNAQALELLRAAVESLDADPATLEPQRLFGLRREAADLSRQWGFYQSIVYGAVGVMPGGAFAPQASAGSVTQTGTEIYWRPPVIGYRNGATFELFVRSFTTLDDDLGGPVGITTMQGSVGVRWKPFQRYNLLLEAARLFRIGADSREDTMLRVAFSESRGTDLRVDVPDWWTGQIYAEAGRYLDIRQTFANFEGRAGRSFRIDAISDRLVLTPFVAVGGSYDNLLATQWAVGAGPGLNARYWFREDRYRAPISYIDATVQYRFKLGGDDRAEGVFAGLTMAY